MLVHKVKMFLISKNPKFIVLGTTVDSTTVYSRAKDCLQQTLNTAAIVGIVLAVLIGGVLIYLCGLLTGFLIDHKRSRSPVAGSRVILEHHLRSCMKRYSQKSLLRESPQASPYPQASPCRRMLHMDHCS